MNRDPKNPKTPPFEQRSSAPCKLHPNYKGTRAPKYCAGCARVYYEMCRRRCVPDYDAFARIERRLHKLIGKCEDARVLLENLEARKRGTDGT